MSSHHFVREGQEPALFIYEAISYDRIAPLLEWAPYLLTTSNVLEKVLSWGVRIDGMLLNELEKDRYYSIVQELHPINVSVCYPDAFFSEGIRHLSLQEQSHANVTVRDSSRISFHTDLILSENFPITFHDSTKKWVLVEETFTKWMPQGSELELQKTADDQLVTVDNSLFDGDIIIAKNDGIMSVSSPKLLWIGEKI